jgi:hypothetical protein
MLAVQVASLCGIMYDTYDMYDMYDKLDCGTI